MTPEEFATREEYETAYTKAKLYGKGYKEAELVYAEFWFWCKWQHIDLDKGVKTAWTAYMENCSAECAKRARELYRGLDDYSEANRTALNDVIRTRRHK